MTVETVRKHRAAAVAFQARACAALAAAISAGDATWKIEGLAEAAADAERAVADWDHLIGHPEDL